MHASGGCSISTASLGDIVIAEPGVLYGFAGRRVIENTIRQKLPPDFQTAEYMLAHGFIDKIVEYKHWYFGHYHFDRRISDKKRCLYDDIISLS